MLQELKKQNFLTSLLIQGVAIAFLFISSVALTIMIAPTAWAAELSCPEDMVYILRGTFKIGSDDSQRYSEERAADDVKVSSFCIDKAVTFIIITLVVSMTWFTSMTNAKPALIDPLPSWNQGVVKQSLIDFVTRVTTKGNPDFVSVEDRIATFDNDGTLWAEQPTYIQVLFVLARLEDAAADDPSLRQKQPFKAVLDRDMIYLSQISEAEVMELLTATHSNITQEQFEAEVRSFYETAIHPTLKVPVTKVGYKPMRELLDYLRANGFQTWICSGGGIDFMRIITEQIYDIPPQQVIGSSGKKEFIDKDGTQVIWRLPEIARVNDKAGKPIGIDLHIGKRPVFAAGNVKSGGDIAMLTYSQQRSPSLQLLINHDDAEREFAYQEKDNASLNAANTNSWTVVSIKNDWKTVFAFQE